MAIYRFNTCSLGIWDVILDYIPKFIGLGKSCILEKGFCDVVVIWIVVAIGAVYI